LQALFIILQACLISSSEIIKGGEMRRQSEANKNQSVSTPPAIQAAINFLFVSNESNSTAIHKPNEPTTYILG
jgi:hypothetical protein